MLLFKYIVPLLASLAFLHPSYLVFVKKFDATTMGIQPRVLKMFALSDLFIAICWMVIAINLHEMSPWIKSLSFFITGMWAFDYVVSLPLYKTAGDPYFKYWGGVSLVVLLVYCIWL